MGCKEIEMKRNMIMALVLSLLLVFPVFASGKKGRKYFQ